MERDRVEQDRAMCRQNAMTTFPIKIVIALVFLFVVRVYEPVLAWSTLAIGVLSGVAFYAAWRARDHERLAFLALALMCLENALFTRWSTPYVIAPMIAVVTGLLSSLYASGRARAVRLWMCLGVVLVPFALEAAGVIAPSLTLGERACHLRVAMAAPVPGWVVVLHFLMIALGSAVGIRAALDRARDTDLRARSQAWLLERVLHPT